MKNAKCLRLQENRIKVSILHMFKMSNRYPNLLLQFNPDVKYCIKSFSVNKNPFQFNKVSVKYKIYVFSATESFSLGLCTCLDSILCDQIPTKTAA